MPGTCPRLFHRSSSCILKHKLKPCLFFIPPKAYTKERFIPGACLSFLSKYLLDEIKFPFENCITSFLPSFLPFLFQSALCAFQICPAFQLCGRGSTLILQASSMFESPNKCAAGFHKKVLQQKQPLPEKNTGSWKA